MPKVLDHKVGLPVKYDSWKHYRKLKKQNKEKKKKRYLLVKQVMAGHIIHVLWPAATSPRRPWDYWRYAQTLEPEEIGLKDVVEDRSHSAQVARHQEQVSQNKESPPK